jgi:hypothetical protein
MLSRASTTGFTAGYFLRMPDTSSSPPPHPAQISTRHCPFLPSETKEVSSRKQLVGLPPMTAQEVMAVIRGAVVMQKDPTAGGRTGSNRTEEHMLIEEVTLVDGGRAVKRFVIATLLILSAMLAPTSPLVTAVVAPTSPLVTAVVAPTSPLVTAVVAPTSPLVTAVVAPTSPLVTAVVIVATRFERNAHASQERFFYLRECGCRKRRDKQCHKITAAMLYSVGLPALRRMLAPSARAQPPAENHAHTAFFAKNALDFSLQTCAAGTGIKAAGKVAQTFVSRNTTRILDLRHDVPDIE